MKAKGRSRAMGGLLLLAGAAMVAASAASPIELGDDTALAGRDLQMAVIPPSTGPESPPEPVPNLAPVIPYDNFTNGENPQQIHLTVWTTPSQMLVSFTTGDPTVTPGTPTPADVPDVSKLRPQVRFGVSKDKFKTAKGKSVNYMFDNSWDFQPVGKRQGYVSAPINHVLIKGLKPSTTYFYQVSGGKVGKDQKPWSPWFNFTTAPSGFPVTIGITADSGNSQNATDTMLRMLGRKPSVVHIVGDLTYADVYSPDGVWLGDDKKQGKYQTCFQQAWDQWARAMQPLFTTIPIKTTPGNHELEFQPPTIGGAVFSSYNARFPMPQTSNPIAQTKPLKTVSNDTVLKPSQTTNMYYSYTLPGVAKMIFITSYIPSDHYNSSTAQYKWFEKELKGVNRQQTPWVVVHSHAPWYSSWGGSFKDTECMRLQYEHLLYKYGVDLVFNGHTHAYERFTPVYNDTSNECGTIHITLGAGGKPGTPPGGVEALDDVPIEKVKWSYCNSTQAWISKNMPKITLMGNVCPTIQPALNGGSDTNICWTAQPQFSAIRNAAFSMGTLEFLSASQARWRMYRNVDPEGTAFDEVVFDRSQPASCSAKNAGR